MKQLLRKYKYRTKKFFGADDAVMDNLRILLGKLLIDRNDRIRDFSSLSEFEFKVFSQWGEDGIIQFLTRRLKTPNKIFIELGVENYKEANTRFLMINDNWSGLVVDSAKSNVDFIRQDDIHWRYDIKAVCSFITRENVNRLIRENIQEADIGLLVIDVDGNDYWIWKAIDAVRARIVVCEYNGIFGCEHSVTVPYDENFVRARKHHSHLYWGASLAALCLLAEDKGYVFVGCNSNGNNAFFVRKDVCSLQPVDCKIGFVMPKFRESRNREQKLDYLSGADRIEAISKMEVFDLKSDKNVLVEDIFRLKP